MGERGGSQGATSDHVPRSAAFRAENSTGRGSGRATTSGHTDKPLQAHPASGIWQQREQLSERARDSTQHFLLRNAAGVVRCKPGESYRSAASKGKTDLSPVSERGRATGKSRTTTEASSDAILTEFAVVFRGATDRSGESKA